MVLFFLPGESENLISFHTIFSISQPTTATSSPPSKTYTMVSKTLLGAGAVLKRGEKLVSPNGKVEAILQDDGNFVVYIDKKDVWASHTYLGSKESSVPDAAGHTLVPQEDGNLVIYAEDGRPVWATNTVGKATGRVTLAVGDEGPLVLVDEAEPPVAVWTSAGARVLGALFDGVKAGATHLAERAAYYSSTAYTESKAKSAEILTKAKTHGEAAYAKAAEATSKALDAAGDAAGKAKDAAADAAHAATEKAKEVAAKVDAKVDAAIH